MHKPRYRLTRMKEEHSTWVVVVVVRDEGRRRCLAAHSSEGERSDFAGLSIRGPFLRLDASPCSMPLLPDDSELVLLDAPVWKHTYCSSV